MGLSRRHFLAATAAFGTSLTARADLLPTPQGRRVVIAGGGHQGALDGLAAKLDEVVGGDAVGLVHLAL